MSTNHLVKNDHGASKNDLAENQLATKLNLIDSALTFENDHGASKNGGGLGDTAEDTALFALSPHAVDGSRVCLSTYVCVCVCVSMYVCVCVKLMIKIFTDMGWLRLVGSLQL